MNDILVLGASGFVGLAVCEKLVEHCESAEARITVASRHPQRGAHLLPLPPVEVVAWRPDDEKALARLVRGRDAVVNLVGILHGREADFQHAHVDLPARLARACAAEGVQRVLHVSALGAAPDAPSMYLRSKAAGERALRDEGPDPVILRPSVMFGAGDRFMNRFARLLRRLPVMPLPCADARLQPVWVDDVAAAVVAALDRHGGEIIECAGPTVYTLRQIVELAGAWSGHPRPVLPIPRAVGELQAFVMELLPGEPPMTRDNLRSLQVPNVATGRHATLASLGIEPRALESVMPDLLAHADGRTRLDALRTWAHR